jgi:KTSC domain
MQFDRNLIVVAIVALCASAQAEIVDVKYRGQVDLKPFTCTNTVSSFVNRVCYDRANSYMLILLKNTWYHYCEIDARTVTSLIAAESVGHFFNDNIKGTGKDGVRLKVFHTEQMNQAVFAFRRYEDASLRYTGLESHEGLAHYGLYDTVVARE